MRVSPLARKECANTIECVVLDAGMFPIDHQEFVSAIQSILNGQAAEIARDRNSICYRVHLAQRSGVAGAVIVKAHRPGPQRTNADTTFAWEAGILAALPAWGIIGVPALLARVAAVDRHFLFTTEVPGKHPDPQAHPLDGRQLSAMLDQLYVMDCHGFMHYDLKPANILVDDERVEFVDFEFARFGDYHHAYAPANAAFCEDFNVSSNPFFPARSNVANFEFRGLHRYLHDLAATQSTAAADALFLDWLRGKSVYHRRMAGFLAQLAASSAGRIATASGITMDETREKLRLAAGHECLLAEMFDQPHDAVARVERSLTAFRCAVFEQRTAEAQRLRHAALIAIGRDADALPGEYRQAVARVLELVGRSIHLPV